VPEALADDDALTSGDDPDHDDPDHEAVGEGHPDPCQGASPAARPAVGSCQLG